MGEKAKMDGKRRKKKEGGENVHREVGRRKGDTRTLRSFEVKK